MRKTLNAYGFSVGTFVAIMGMLLGAVAGFVTLQVNVEANAFKNAEQDRLIEKMDDENDKAAVQRGRIEQDVKHILELLQRRDF